MPLQQQSITKTLAQELNCREQQITAVMALLDEGATVPFIARYRKEMTGGLDDGQLRQLQTRLTYLTDLNDRRNTILKAIEEQEKLTPALKNAILSADNKTELEDLYLPYKSKRRTKGQIAIEAGLLPLAELILADRSIQPEQAARRYKVEGFTDEKAVLDGCKSILMEQFAQDAHLLANLRTHLWQNAYMVSKMVKGKEQDGEKFKDYFEFSQFIKNIPSHRALALFRGKNEGCLSLSLMLDANDTKLSQGLVEQFISQRLTLKLGGADRTNAANIWLAEVVKKTWSGKLKGSMETELFGKLREAADQGAIDVFGKNLNDLLLAAPAGARTTLGLDPGFRSGVKVAVVDATGKILDHCAIYPHQPQNQWDQSLATLASLVKKHKVELIAIGNGTASRETDKLAVELLKGLGNTHCKKVMVSEAGASVYSASEFAAKEFPDLDVTIRGAISIARRLQDPLAELVKIDPKAIGVGQYQHDVNQTALAHSLDAVVEVCVNGVGVDLNTASAPLLARVAGLNQTIANNIVEYRQGNGAFTDRKQLKKVARLGPKAFEQAAGFLRIQSAKNPLDASAVHPESYDLVKTICQSSGKTVANLMGDSQYLQTLDPAKFANEKFGLPTVKDILSELDKPGRDPRPEFKTAEFADGVEKISDLKEGMILQGVATNVTNFGAFVDIGVHQDGLVHISNMSDKFIDDPSKIVKAGDIIKVKVMEVDAQRKRIALTMRLSDEIGSKPTAKAAPNSNTRNQNRHPKAPKQATQPQGNGSLGDLLMKVMKR